MIVWTPPDQVFSSRKELRATAGAVKLIAWPDTAGEAKAYARVDGAISPQWRSASQPELIAKLFMLYTKMVLQGINPIAAHLALSELDEYRDNLSPEFALGPAPQRLGTPVVQLRDYRERAQQVS